MKERQNILVKEVDQKMVQKGELGISDVQRPKICHLKKKQEVNMDAERTVGS